MKAIHNVSKILLKVAEVSLSAVIVLSLIPVMSGGLTLSEPVTAAGVDPDNGSNVLITGSTVVRSSLMWDMDDFSYEVAVGRGDNVVARSDPVTTAVKKNSSTDLDFRISVPFVSLALLTLDSGVSKGIVKDMTVPLTVSVGGSYIQSLVRFDLDLDLSVAMNVPVAGSISYTDDKLDISVNFNPGGTLPGMDKTVVLKSSGGQAQCKVELVDDGAGGYTLNVEIDGAGVDLLDILNGEDLVVEDGGTEIPGDQAEELARLLQSMIDKQEGTP